MGSLARPSPPLERLRPTPPGFPPEAREQGYGRWFWEFLTDELRPYPGRAAIVTRMVLSATLTMGVIMTFRLPGSALAVYYTLLLARQSPRATFRGALAILGAYLTGGVYCLLGIWLLIDYPITHFLWVVVSLFLSFFVMRVMTNTAAAGGFAFMVTILLPLWDAPLPIGTLMTATMWAAGSVSVGLVVTVLVEYIFTAFEGQDELLSGISERLAALSSFLRHEAEGDAEEAPARRTISQLAVVGVSRLRRLAVSGSSTGSTVGNSTTVSLVGRLVDLAASYPHISEELRAAESAQLHALAERIDRLDQHLTRGEPVEQDAAELARKELGPQQLGAQQKIQDPLLLELERTTELLQLSMSEPRQQAVAADQVTSAAPGLFLPDAFTNSEHLVYALRGCLAASLCYVLINAIAWRGISTALATCVITALSSIGSSRQKQVLRLSGAMVGGLIFGLGAQVLVLPALDSIAGFAVLFAGVTAFAAWFSTASPRLSYFGLQVALAFYLINLQEFYLQTNIAIGRDGVIGILLGLIAMWLVYDTIGSVPAIEVMQNLFATNLKLLAELADPWKDAKPPDLRHIRTLRDRVSANFGSVNAQSDAVLFETGPERHHHLWLREHLLAWQPRLRSIFLIKVALLQYRTQVHPEHLAPEVLAAQRQFDRSVSHFLMEMQTVFERGEMGAKGPSPAQQTASIPSVELDAAQASLEAAIQREQRPVSATAQGVLALNATLVDILKNLAEEIASAHDLGVRVA